MTALQNQKNEGIVQYNMSNKPFNDPLHLLTNPIPFNDSPNLLTKGGPGCASRIKIGHLFQKESNTFWCWTFSVVFVFGEFYWASPCPVSEKASGVRKIYESAEVFLCAFVPLDLGNAV